MSVSYEIKAVNDEKMIVEGYGSKFGNIDRVGDIVVKGAFADDLDRMMSEAVYMYQHESKQTIGRFIDAKEDDYGLWYKAQLSDIPVARDVYTLIKDGVLKKNSIGYSIREYDWLNSENLEQYVTDEPTLHEIQKALYYGRALKKVEVLEISVVSVPANRGADITGVKQLLLDGLTFDQQASLLLDGLKGLNRRIAEIKAIREQQGNYSPKKHTETLNPLIEQAERVLTEMQALKGGGNEQPATVSAAELAELDLQRLARQRRQRQTLLTH